MVSPTLLIWYIVVEHATRLKNAIPQGSFIEEGLGVCLQLGYVSFNQLKILHCYQKNIEGINLGCQPSLFFLNQQAVSLKAKLLLIITHYSSNFCLIVKHLEYPKYK